MVLDSLNENFISEIVVDLIKYKKVFKFIDLEKEDDLKSFCKDIRDVTGGVPRLIEYTLKILHHLKISYSQHFKEILCKDVFDQIKKYAPDRDKYYVPNEIESAFYTMNALSKSKITISEETKFLVKNTTYTASKLFGILPIYIEGDSDNIRIINSIYGCLLLDERIQNDFRFIFFNTIPSEVGCLFKKGELLELSVASSLHLNSKYSTNKKWEESYNFLKGQILEQKINLIQIFPKVTKKSSLIDLKDIKLEEISKKLTCLPEQFNDLIKYVPDRSLLLMRDMSSSMDLMYIYSQNISLSFQCKDTSFAQIEDEMNKIPYSNERKDLFILVTMNIQKDFLLFIDCNLGFSIFNEGKYYILNDRYLVWSKIEPKQENQRIYNEIYFQDGSFPIIYERTGIYYIKEGKTFLLCRAITTTKHVFSVRKNMSLIFLQEKGVKQLIGERTYENLIRLKDDGTSKVKFVQNVMSDTIVTQKGKKNEKFSKEKKQKMEGKLNLLTLELWIIHFGEETYTLGRKVIEEGLDSVKFNLEIEIEKSLRLYSDVQMMNFVSFDVVQQNPGHYHAKLGKTL